MKYQKKISKSYLALSDQKALPTDQEPLFDRFKNTAALLEGSCSHFYISSKPAPLADAAYDKLIDCIQKSGEIEDEAQLIHLYGGALKALCEYKSCTAQKKADGYISQLGAFLSKKISDVLDSCEASSIKNPYFTLSAIGGLCSYLMQSKDEQLTVLLKRFCDIATTITNGIKDDVYDYLTTLSAIAQAAVFSGESEFNGVIGILFDYFILNAQSLNYESAKSFSSLDETSAAATALSLETALCIFKLTGDDRYRTVARRIWFNAMQFCQRENGAVGSNTFTKQDQNLRVKKYQIIPFETPLYAIGLKSWFVNKQLFDVEGRLFKDRRGRYFIGDKIFGLDQSGFFGKDLIEIPTLTAFDMQTALQFDFKLVF